MMKTKSAAFYLNKTQTTAHKHLQNCVLPAVTEIDRKINQTETGGRTHALKKEDPNKKKFKHTLNGSDPKTLKPKSTDQPSHYHSHNTDLTNSTF